MDDGYLDTTPARPPPPGHESNFVNPESTSYQLVIVISVLSFLTILFTSGRIYTRLRVTHSFGIDDCFCIAATICTLAYSGLVLELCQMPGGGILGIHLWDVSLRRLTGYMKGSLADSILICMSITLIKISFFLTYRRLFLPVTHVKIMIWVGISLVATFCFVSIILYPVACAPWPSEQGGWLDPSMAQRCDNIATNLITAGAWFSVFTDFYIMAIPLHQVPKMRLSRRKKVEISFIFLTGLLASGAGLTNLVFRQNTSLLDPADFSWTIVPIYATCMAEINIGLVALSMPVVSAQFFGRLTEIGKSLSSWIRSRRTPLNSRAGGGESSSDLSPGAHDQNNPHATPPTPTTAPLAQHPQLPHVPNATLSGMRKLIRNLQRSRVTISSLSAAPAASFTGHDDGDDDDKHVWTTTTTITSTTFNDLTSADLSYHVQLKKMRASQSANESERGSGKKVEGHRHLRRENEV